MAADKTVSILIDIQDRLDGLDRSVTGIAQLEEKTASMGHALQIGFGVDVVRRFANELARVPSMMMEATRRGIEYNRVMQDMVSSTQAVVLASQGMRQDLPRAVQIATDTVQELERAAQTAGVATADMFALFQRVAPVAENAGIGIEPLVQLLKEVAVGAQNMGVSISEMTTRLPNMLAGLVSSENVFARALGIDAETMRKALEAGNVVEMMSARLADWQGEVTGMSAESARLSNILDRAFGQATQAVFAALEGEIAALGDTIASLENETLEDLGRQMARMIELGGDLARIAVENQGAFFALGKVLVGLGITFSAVKMTQMITQWTQKARVTIASTAAVQKETAALAANTAAHARNTAARTAGTAATARGTAGRMAGGAIALAGGPVGAMVLATLALNEAMQVYLNRLEKKIERQIQVARNYAEEGQHLIGIIEKMETQQDLENALLTIRRARARAMEEAASASGEELRAAEDHLFQLEWMERNAESILQTRGEENRVARLTAELNARIAESDERRLEMLERAAVIEKRLVDLRQRYEAAVYREADPQTQLRMLDDMEQRAKDAYAAAAAKIDPHMDEEAQKQLEEARLRLELELLEITARRNDIESQMADQAKEHGEARLAVAEEIQILEAQLAGNYELVRRLEFERDLRLEIARIMEATGVSEEKAAEIARRRLDLLDQLKNKHHSEARLTVLEDIRILEARAAGNHELVRRLEFERDLRLEIARIMEATGVSEEQATAAARRKLILLDMVKRQERTPDRSGDSAPRRGGSRMVDNRVRPFAGQSYVRDGAAAVGLQEGFMDRYERLHKDRFEGVSATSVVAGGLPMPHGAFPAQTGSGQSIAAAGDAGAGAIESAGEQATAAVQKLSQTTVTTLDRIRRAVDDLATRVRDAQNR